MTKKDKLPRANDEIDDVSKVRLVGSSGEMIGIVTIEEALKKAKSISLDLVEISPNAEPPVCKIMDFGRYKYESKKKAHNAKKKQKTVSTKEIKLRPNISDHDLQIKLKSILKFINSGDKVKISIRFKGREITHQELGFRISEKILETVKDIAKIEYEPKIEGKQILLIIAPK